MYTGRPEESRTPFPDRKLKRRPTKVVFLSDEFSGAPEGRPVEHLMQWLDHMRQAFEGESQ